MKLLFVHGWSVTNTKTYGVLPEVIAAQSPNELNLDIQHVYLGQYISFRDEVRMTDLVVALNHALADIVEEGTSFSCITHSTGGPVIREWIQTYYGKDRLDELPLKHLIMLAPANHGSALAQLGKARVGRIQAWFDDVEPGQGILDWLELGSSEQWQLNAAWLEYPQLVNFFPFVITGQDIDKKFYDYLNSYTGEKGSDGVVRVAAANLNYRMVKMEQSSEHSVSYSMPNGEQGSAQVLELAGQTIIANSNTAFEILPNTSHSQENKGIMASVTKANQAKKQVVQSIIECLKVDSPSAYADVLSNMQKRTNDVQTPSQQHSMVVFKVMDSHGRLIKDYDIYLLAGKDYQPDQLPKGFFTDKQKNKINQCHLTYYFNHNKLSEIEEKRDNKIGFRIIARPDSGFAYYKAAEFRSNSVEFSDIFKANETLMVEIILKRYVAANAFNFTTADKGEQDFKERKPSKKEYQV